MMMPVVALNRSIHLFIVGGSASMKVYVVDVLFVISPSHAKSRKREELHVCSVKVKSG